MTHFTIHTQETAPATSKPLLDKSLKAFAVCPDCTVCLPKR